MRRSLLRPRPWCTGAVEGDEGEEVGLHVLLAKDFRQPIDDIRMLRGDVVLLGGVRHEVEQLKVAFGGTGRFRIERARWGAVNAAADEFPRLRIGAAEMADEFPLALADELRAAALRDLAVEE